jgi:hypothetical protein
MATLIFSESFKDLEQVRKYHVRLRAYDRHFGRRLARIIPIVRELDAAWARSKAPAPGRSGAWPRAVTALYAKLHREVLARLEHMQRAVRQGYTVHVHANADEAPGGWRWGEVWGCVLTEQEARDRAFHVSELVFGPRAQFIRDGVGTLAHEMTHVLWWADSWDTYQGTAEGWDNDPRLALADPCWYQSFFFSGSARRDAERQLRVLLTAFLKGPAGRWGLGSPAGRR